MLIIAGTIGIAPEKTDLAVEAIGPMCEATRAEEGCDDYVFTVNPHVPGELRVFERWVDGSALEAHFATPHMAAFREVLATCDVRRREITRYEVESATEM
jgi:quinol monooxygenase YgiN